MVSIAITIAHHTCDAYSQWMTVKYTSQGYIMIPADGEHQARFVELLDSSCLALLFNFFLQDFTCHVLPETHGGRREAPGWPLEQQSLRGFVGEAGEKGERARHRAHAGPSFGSWRPRAAHISSRQRRLKSIRVSGIRRLDDGESYSEPLLNSLGCPSSRRVNFYIPIRAHLNYTRSCGSTRPIPTFPWGPVSITALCPLCP